MFNTVIGTYTDKYSELGNVKKIVSYVEFMYLTKGKRTISKDNMTFNTNLKYWLFSPNSGMYFLRTAKDTPELRGYIQRGFVFMVIDEAHEYDLRAGIDVIGNKYGKKFDYYSEYLPLVESILAYEAEAGKTEKNDLQLAILKDKIKKITKP